MSRDSGALTACENAALTADVRSTGFLRSLASILREVHSRTAGEAAPPRTGTFKSCGHRYAESFRSVVRVAYPLTGPLLLISRSSADCVSSVRDPPEAASRRLCHWCVWVHLSAISVEAAYLLSKRSEDTRTRSILHERSVKQLPKDVTPDWNQW